MIFSLDVRRALKGDCFFVHYGSKNDPGLALIDGGPKKVYKDHLRPRIVEIRDARGLSDDDSLGVDLLMISHIDEDHIQGIVELTDELADALDSREPLLVKIRSLWHNSFDKIIGNKPDELLSAVTACYGLASLGGAPDTEGLDPDAAMVLASVEQGCRVRDNANKLRLRINPQFGKDAVMATDDGESKDMDKGLKFTVLGPSKAELVALRKKYDAFLKKQKNAKKTTAALAAFTDTSVPNLSSLVVLAEVDKKRMLLTGDARGDKILEGLERAGLLKKRGKMHVDILKVPHHGSDRNLEPIFFRRITAEHYVFSGNGQHGNPERETMQMLLDERGDEDYTIHLTYPIKEIDAERKKDWDKERAKEQAKKKKDKKAKVRATWSPKKHGLTSFFAANNKFAKKVSVVSEGEAYVINLLEEVGF